MNRSSTSTRLMWTLKLKVRVSVVRFQPMEGTGCSHSGIALRVSDGWICRPFRSQRGASAAERHVTGSGGGSGLRSLTLLHVMYTIPHPAPHVMQRPPHPAPHVMHRDPPTLLHTSCTETPSPCSTRHAQRPPHPAPHVMHRDPVTLIHTL